MANSGAVQRSVSFPLERVISIEKYCTETERNFSQAVAYLCRMGLIYVQEVLPIQHQLEEEGRKK